MGNHQNYHVFKKIYKNMVKVTYDIISQLQKIVFQVEIVVLQVTYEIHRIF